jgi:hypothetical protein
MIVVSAAHSIGTEIGTSGKGNIISSGGVQVGRLSKSEEVDMIKRSMSIYGMILV